MNDFLVGEAKIAENNQDNQIQSITLCNMYFSKKVYAVYNGIWNKAPEAGEFSRIFVLKVTLHFVAPPIILLGEQLLPCSLHFRAYVNFYMRLRSFCGVFWRQRVTNTYNSPTGAQKTVAVTPFGLVAAYNSK